MREGDRQQGRWPPRGRTSANGRPWQPTVPDLAGLRAAPHIRREPAPFAKKPVPLTVSPRVALEVGFRRAKADAGKRTFEGGRRD